MSIYEGKRPISARGYLLLAAYALRSADNRLGSVYPHVFTILCWNLFARSINVGALMLQHISWENDCMKITLPRHKGDQEGARIYPKRLMRRLERAEEVSDRNNAELRQFFQDLKDELFTRMPQQIEERITARFQINGVVQVTRDDLERFEERIVNRMGQIINQGQIQQIAEPQNDAERDDNNGEMALLRPVKQGCFSLGRLSHGIHIP